MEKTITGDVEIVINPYSSLPCEAETFLINGIAAEIGYFGFTESSPCPDDCECYGCHSMHFVPCKVTEAKSNVDKENLAFLTYEQIEEIQKILEEVFDVGDCGWCE